MHIQSETNFVGDIVFLENLPRLWPVFSHILVLSVLLLASIDQQHNDFYLLENRKSAVNPTPFKVSHAYFPVFLKHTVYF